MKHKNLFVSRTAPGASDDMAPASGALDHTASPHLRGVRRREAVEFQELFPHLQQFDTADGTEGTAGAWPPPLFAQPRNDIEPRLEHCAPAAWRSPADAMARRFSYGEAP